MRNFLNLLLRLVWPNLIQDFTDKEILKSWLYEIIKRKRPVHEIQAVVMQWTVIYVDSQLIAQRNGCTVSFYY